MFGLLYKQFSRIREINKPNFPLFYYIEFSFSLSILIWQKITIMKKLYT